MSKKKDICRRCGKCCYTKIRIGEIEVFTKQHCRFLDEKSKLCTIYKERFKKNPKCLTVEQAIAIRALPRDCPYVQNIKNYKAPLEYY